MPKPTYNLKFNKIDCTYSYPMDNPSRGYLVMFNQVVFDDKDLNDGSKKDVEELEKTAKSLGFEKNAIIVLNNETKANVEAELEELSSKNHSDNDCFVCVILAHGDENDIVHSKDKPMNLIDFTNEFSADKRKSLAGKPKLFFIQCCRGGKPVEGLEVKLSTTMTAESKPRSYGPDKEILTPVNVKITTRNATIPTALDFLIAHSTIPLHKSWINPKTGTCFIQSLASVFKNFGNNLELMEMMTLVNREVAFDFEYYDNELIKQLPSVTSQLLAKVYFNPKKTIPDEEPENSKA